MNEKIFQEIFDKLQDFLPAGWSEVIFFAGYTEDSYSMKFYVDCGRGGFVDCFELDGAERKQLTGLFIEIDNIIYPEREALDNKNKWSVMTMKVDSQGKMNTEFDYTDISENYIEYKRKWGEKYLGG